MKIVFTGGGTGGHFYPLIAVAEELNNIIDEEHIAGAKLFYFSDTPYDSEALLENGIKFVSIIAGKRRIYRSFQNFLDLFKIAFGILQAFVKLLFIFPDIIFAKGGYASFPTLFAARLLGIPIIIHESDSVPGRVNVWAGKFAKKIAVSYREASEYFPGQDKKIAHTGQPIRKEIRSPAKTGAYEFLELNKNIPVIFVQGGSQGAHIINYAIESILSKLVEKYQIIHQVGGANIEEFKKLTDSTLHKNPNRNRYKQFPFLNPLAMKMTSGVANLIISRAGSAIFEIAVWGIPSIIIPITKTNGDHQRKNAFNYARHGACAVIEESNLQPNILLSEIDRILGNKEIHEKMSEAALKFSSENAAKKIAKAIVDISLSHEK